jgi:branched-chain amino acid transport system permease protein
MTNIAATSRSLITPSGMLGIAVLALILAPWAVYPAFVMKLLCFGLYACAFNLLLGHVGVLSFGHAAFFGGGAYITAHAMKEWGVTPEIAILAAAGFAAALGLVIGFVAIRRQGIYFSMITLSLAQLFYFYCLQASFTKGEDGIQGVPRGQLFGLIDLERPMAMYYFVLCVTLLGVAFIWRIVRSPFGTILKAIRENEARAVSLGYNVNVYKMKAFVLSAALTGVAGALKALVFQLATLTDVGWHMSGEVVVMTVLGGVGTIFGPFVGAGVIVTLEHYLASSGLPTPVVIGFIFMSFVLLFRRGIVGEIEARMASTLRRN